MKKPTPYIREKISFVLKTHREGKSNEWISRKLKVTRERVRQLLKMAE